MDYKVEAFHVEAIQGVMSLGQLYQPLRHNQKQRRYILKQIPKAEDCPAPGQAPLCVWQAGGGQAVTGLCLGTKFKPNINNCINWTSGLNIV